MSAEGLAVPVRVVGMVRGREIDMKADVSLDRDAVVLAWQEAAPWRLSFAGIEGLHSGASSLTVYLEGHDVLELSGQEELRTLGAQLMDRACALPEFTRGLKYFGASRVIASTAHDHWFAPLLAARRAVAGVSDPLRQVMLMDAGQIADDLRAAIARIAIVQAPENAAEQRAIEASLEEEAIDTIAALEAMRLAADVVRGGALDTRLADWRRWVETTHTVFSAADQALGEMEHQ